jgi:hypothetical protein
MLAQGKGGAIRRAFCGLRLAECFVSPVVFGRERGVEGKLQRESREADTKLWGCYSYKIAVVMRLVFVNWRKSRRIHGAV